MLEVVLDLNRPTKAEVACLCNDTASIDSCEGDGARDAREHKPSCECACPLAQVGGDCSTAGSGCCSGKGLADGLALCTCACAQKAVCTCTCAQKARLTSPRGEEADNDEEEATLLPHRGVKDIEGDQNWFRDRCRSA
jgi:hypothetical protein